MGLHHRTSRFCSRELHWSPPALLHGARSETEKKDSDFQERPHHTAIVERVDGQGAITLLEQNVPDGSAGQRTQLLFSNVSTDSGGRRTTISVHGRFWFYRPSRAEVDRWAYVVTPAARRYFARE
ncbi:MAG TPA: hypothetical protein VJT81_05700 [Burkholderiales bacterium]|nr:hypothetical protein [Burkholderiales bacterium]